MPEKASPPRTLTAVPPPRQWLLTQSPRDAEGVSTKPPAKTCLFFTPCRLSLSGEPRGSAHQSRCPRLWYARPSGPRGSRSPDLSSATTGLLFVSLLLARRPPRPSRWSLFSLVVVVFFVLFCFFPPCLLSFGRVSTCCLFPSGPGHSWKCQRQKIKARHDWPCARV